MAAWEYEILEDGDEVAAVRLSTRLRRSPFRIERTMRVEAGKPALILSERIVNEGRESMEYVWGHHPAYGAPFLSEACRIDISARCLWADELQTGSLDPLKPDEYYTWPIVERNGTAIDLSRVPGPQTARHIMAYFGDFESGWYAVTNTQLGFGVGLVWPVEVFPYAWFWQEMHASSGFPWYKAAYVMAIEPFTSIPSEGLVAVMEKTDTQRTLSAGESIEVELRAVFYESNVGVHQIDCDGTVRLR